MRLINTKTLDFEEFPSSETVNYAILSHTWGNEEVSFKDFAVPTRVGLKGWGKIEATCREAKQYGYHFAWVDTCCIDKSSSAELSESINSMYKWYKEASVCYVYLQDLEPEMGIEEWLPRCRWITRGWTLQELIAPKYVLFFDRHWKLRGNKLELLEALRCCTKISASLLSNEKELAEFSIARKMAWAAQRQTTRVEDAAYCLMGLFDVNMPLLYGEGRKAFRRLQEEIVKQKGDLSILAWRNDPGDDEWLGIFAPSPAAFSDMEQFQPSHFYGNITITGHSLQIQGPYVFLLRPQRGLDGRLHHQYVLPLGTLKEQIQGTSTVSTVGVSLRQAAAGLFYREGKQKLVRYNNSQLIQRTVFKQHLLVNPPFIGLHRVDEYAKVARLWSVHIPTKLPLLGAAPYHLWDERDRIFLRRGIEVDHIMGAMVAVKVVVQIGLCSAHIVVLRELDSDDPQINMGRLIAYEAVEFPRQTDYLFGMHNKHSMLWWEDIKFHMPELAERAVTSNSVDVWSRKANMFLTCIFEIEIVGAIMSGMEVCSLVIQQRSN